MARYLMPSSSLNMSEARALTAQYNDDRVTESKCRRRRLGSWRRYGASIASSNERIAKKPSPCFIAKKSAICRSTFDGQTPVYEEQRQGDSSGFTGLNTKAGDSS